MLRWSVAVVVCAVAVWSGLAGPALADLSFSAISTDAGRVILVRGAFAFTDDLSAFDQLALQPGVFAVTFSSPGGNILKAMELGRVIRRRGLATLQLSSGECESACSLAFMGGTVRMAEPGSIGVHKSSLADAGTIGAADAVSTVQDVMSQTMAYMAEMGVDPALLQLAMQYDASDIRYLSLSEMQRYRVVTAANAAAPSVPAAPAIAASETPLRDDEQRDAPLPQPRSGVIQHPDGVAAIRSGPSEAAPGVGRLRDGMPVSIIAIEGNWLGIAGGGVRGYAHASWVHVDQYASLPYGQRTIQIRSFAGRAEAETFAEQSPLPLDIYRAANGWYAVTTRGIFSSKQEGLAVLRRLKSSGTVPKDSMLSFGNTYAQKICCN